MFNLLHSKQSDDRIVKKQQKNKTNEPIKISFLCLMFSGRHHIKTLAYFQNFATPHYSKIQVTIQKKQDKMKQKSRYD